MTNRKMLLILKNIWRSFGLWNSRKPGIDMWEELNNVYLLKYLNINKSSDCFHRKLFNSIVYSIVSKFLETFAPFNRLQLALIIEKYLRNILFKYFKVFLPYSFLFLCKLTCKRFKKMLKMKYKIFNKF